MSCDKSMQKYKPRKVHADAVFVLKNTTGFSRKEPPVAYKEQHREKYLCQFMTDLNRKDNENKSLENQKQAQKLNEEALELEKCISEYEEKVSTAGEIATKLEECAKSRREEQDKLLKVIENQQKEIAYLEKEVIENQKLLEKYHSYHTFMNMLHAESGKAVEDLDTLRYVFSSIQDQCIFILKENITTKKELKEVQMEAATAKTESEAQLKTFQAPVNNLHLSHQKVVDRNRRLKTEIRKLELGGVSIDATMKKVVYQVNSTYKSCIVHSSINVSTEMMLAEIEYFLYNLLDTMKTIPQEKLLATAKARRKEELRRQQEIKLEALKKR